MLKVGKFTIYQIPWLNESIFISVPKNLEISNTRTVLVDLRDFVKDD